jgi:hypothetical protein
LRKLDERLAGGAHDMISCERDCVLIHENLTLSLGECFDFGTVWEGKPVKLHLCISLSAF